jgi:hypothetical protein
VHNDTGVGISHFMFAISIHSGVAPQLPGPGDDNFRKRLHIFELFNCTLPGVRTDKIGVMTVVTHGHQADSISRGAGAGDAFHPVWPTPSIWRKITLNEPN